MALSTRPKERPTYVYGVVRNGFLPRQGLLGVDDAPVRAVSEGPLTALVSFASAADAGLVDDRRRLTDLRRLAAMAEAHRRVVDEAAAAVCVLPLRLGTVHRGDESVRRALAACAQRYERLLTRLDGRLEWGVKAYAEAPPGWSGGNGAGRLTPSVESGQEVLRRRLRERQARTGALQEADGLARVAHRALEAIAECSRVHRPQDLQLADVAGTPDGPQAESSDPDGPLTAASPAALPSGAYWASPISRAPYPHGRNLLDSAYLVRREAAGAFAETVGELAVRAAALRIELTGPWAPYSFTEPDHIDGRTPPPGPRHDGLPPTT